MGHRHKKKIKTQALRDKNQEPITPKSPPTSVSQANPPDQKIDSKGHTPSHQYSGSPSSRKMFSPTDRNKFLSDTPPSSWADDVELESMTRKAATIKIPDIGKNALGEEIGSLDDEAEERAPLHHPIFKDLSKAAEVKKESNIDTAKQSVLAALNNIGLKQGSLTYWSAKLATRKFDESYWDGVLDALTQSVKEGALINSSLGNETLKKLTDHMSLIQERSEKADASMMAQRAECLSALKQINDSYSKLESLSGSIRKLVSESSPSSIKVGPSTNARPLASYEVDQSGHTRPVASHIPAEKIDRLVDYVIGGRNMHELRQAAVSQWNWSDRVIRIMREISIEEFESRLRSYLVKCIDMESALSEVGRGFFL